MKWRVGTKVPLNVYEGDRPICQCHTASDARRIVIAINRLQQSSGESLREPGQSMRRRNSNVAKKGGT